MNEAKGELSKSLSPDIVALDEHEIPQNLAKWRKWLAVLVISASSLCITCTSTLAAFAEVGIASEFKVKKIVSVLSVSLFIEGLGIGPLIVGPLSEVFGRNPIYRASYVLLFAFSWAVAFAPDIVFRLFTGLCGAAFLSVAGGSVTDLFSDREVATPMAIYTISPFLGPVIGPLISGFINQHLEWRWTFYLVIAWSFAQLVALYLCVPETFVPVLLKRKVRKLAAQNRENLQKRRLASDQQRNPDQLLYSFQTYLVGQNGVHAGYMVVMGILYLSFQVYPIIFEQQHGFNLQETGLGFLGIGVGLLMGLATQPLWNRFHDRITERNNGKLPPEARLYMGQVGGICIPVSLFWLAFTTYPSVHWIVPIIASVPFGAGIYFVYTSTFTYLVTAYRPVAASAMAGNSAMRATFGAVFPLFAGAMYTRLGTVGATALLAGLMTLIAPLPFVIARIGPSLRRQSRFAV
ncbi:hypothetical protein NP233_g10402 [Leucocoprinus birnbaumii]|uniref:Major facilitator superfamily (MFS) profile domain-containing protein n=1 Tax=Leucocoprinus birnbaumii TaxID=56174 RepID=A0AAD5VIJ1_9AGAR|nr:hypothetical protein NP233_g10402 [Leucocoprinus birnbaumii]